jgi:hypothetical protein
MSEGLAEDPQEEDEQPPEDALASIASIEAAEARPSREIIMVDISSSFGVGYTIPGEAANAVPEEIIK